jgi:predicted enzyme related to lactoylglutathione lyase
MSHLTILYVASVPASSAFYEAVLGVPPLEASPGFAMFPLSEGSMLGLWKRDAVVPAVEGPSAGFELAFEHADLAALEAFLASCRKAGAGLIQDVVKVDFGTTFCAVDPDGHRLRGLVPPSMPPKAP